MDCSWIPNIIFNMRISDFVVCKKFFNQACRLNVKFSSEKKNSNHELSFWLFRKRGIHQGRDVTLQLGGLKSGSAMQDGSSPKKPMQQKNQCKL